MTATFPVQTPNRECFTLPTGGQHSCRTPRRCTNILSIYPHITDRDRVLLDLLDEHQVLTTNQIHRLLFHAERTCQIRLAELRALELVERFRFARPGGGTHPWHWTLGHIGHRFQAAAHTRPEPTTRTSRHRLARISANPHLTHLLAVNEFFTRLAAHARRNPSTRLDRWWSEKTTTAQFLTVRPDGHGLWTENDHTIGFFLEVDQGTEALNRLPTKLASYTRLAATTGIRYPILFWLTSTNREEHLHTLLRHHTEDRNVPVATATRDTDPAHAVWLPTHGYQRITLAELPNDHGRDTAANPNYRDGCLHLGP